jgi:hypothetical protein
MDNTLISLAYAMRIAMQLDGEQIPSEEELTALLQGPDSEDKEYLAKGMQNIADQLLKHGWTPPVSQDTHTPHEPSIIPLSVQYWDMQSAKEEKSMADRLFCKGEAFKHLVNHVYALKQASNPRTGQ